MRADRRRLGARAAAGLVAATLTGGAALTAAAPVTAAGGGLSAASFSVLNGTVNAGADRFQAGSDAFPNFRNGAFNNFYPLAHAHLDGSPSTEATASPADTGPFGQSLAAGALAPNPPFPQPQYATAKYPPGTTAPVTFGSPGGPYATATAGAQSASALGAFAGTGASAASPAASGPATVTSPATSPAGSARSAALTQLEAALAAWRSEWLTAADRARYPAVQPNASIPDGATAGTAQASTALDSAQGLLVSGSAHVQSASFAGGMVRFGSVDVSVTVSNAGSPNPHVSINVGSASVGGVPVTVNHDGVSVAGALIPGLGLALDQANAALNQVLGQAGYKITTLGPQLVRSANQVTVDAVGAQVEYDQPEVAPGVPRQQAVHQLGNVSVDSLAAPGSPPAPPGPAVTVPPLPTGSGAVAPGSVFVPGSPSVPATAGSPGVPAPPASASPVSGRQIAVRRSKPIDLVLLYFLWQSLLVGTVASLWWRRAGMREVAA